MRAVHRAESAGTSQALRACDWGPGQAALTRAGPADAAATTIPLPSRNVRRARCERIAAHQCKGVGGEGLVAILRLSRQPSDGRRERPGGGALKTVEKFSQPLPGSLCPGSLCPTRYLDQSAGLDSLEAGRGTALTRGHHVPWAAASRSRQTDHLGVNELQAGLCPPFAQLEELCRSHRVGAGRLRCCTSLLYRRPSRRPAALALILSMPYSGRKVDDDHMSRSGHRYQLMLGT